jgi:hypothetical protein
MVPSFRVYPANSGLSRVKAEVTTLGRILGSEVFVKKNLSAFS